MSPAAPIVTFTHPIRAAVSRCAGRTLRIEELRLADPGKEEVRVRITATAICGSDLAYLMGEWEAPRPAVFGHESSGVVDAVGTAVAGLSVGDRVVVTLVRTCGSCRFCIRGYPVACSGEFGPGGRTPLRDSSGARVYQGLHVGGFATAVVVHRSQVVKIAAGMPLELAALLACGVMTGVGAVLNTAQVESGSHVVVLGCGGVGINVVQGARLADAATVTVFDPDLGKREEALRIGATHSVADGESLREGVEAATGGAMADYVIVATSSVAAVEAGFSLLAPTGSLVLVGMPPTGVTARMDVGAVTSLNQRVLGSKMGSSRPETDIPRLVDLYRRGRLELEGLVDERYPLERINEAIESAATGSIRNLIIMDETRAL